MSQAQIFAGAGCYTSLQWVVGSQSCEYRNERKLAVVNAFPSSFLIYWKGVGGVVGVDRCWRKACRYERDGIFCTIPLGYVDSVGSHDRNISLRSGL